MNHSSRTPLALAAIGLTLAVLVVLVLRSVGDVVHERDVARREAIGRRTVTEATTMTAAAIAMLLTVGWVAHRDARRRATAERLLRADHQAALDARVAALRREQQARADAELASQVKDDFLATVSHELRTPLNAIVGWTHVLKRGLLDGPDRQHAVEAVDRNAAMLTRLVNDLLDVSRLIQGQLKLNVVSLDLRNIARAAGDTLRSASAAKNLTVAMRLDHDHVPVAADEGRLQQVAWHVLSNAIKFTPPGGYITVEVSRLGSRARMRITDSGEGIDATLLPNVFDSFRRGARIGRPGLGVGLSIVRHLVELHGGTVALESPGPGRGTVVTLLLPLGPRARESRDSTSRGAGRRTRTSLGSVT
jgi:signal transduction histidine kinase